MSDILLDLEKTYLCRRHNSRSVQFLLHLVQRTYHEGGTAIFSARLAWTLHDFLPNEVNNRANVYSINTKTTLIEQYVYFNFKTMQQNFNTSYT
jgi:hypothetical protein